MHQGKMDSRFRGNDDAQELDQGARWMNGGSNP
jgi:hypothetical protein